MLCMYDIDLCYVVLSELRMWVCTHSMYTISTQSFDTVLVLHVVYTHTYMTCVHGCVHTLETCMYVYIHTLYLLRIIILVYFIELNGTVSSSS
jgi:hypothetical protein